MLMCIPVNHTYMIHVHVHDVCSTHVYTTYYVLTFLLTSCILHTLPGIVYMEDVHLSYTRTCIRSMYKCVQLYIHTNTLILIHAICNLPICACNMSQRQYCTNVHRTMYDVQCTTECAMYNEKYMFRCMRDNEGAAAATHMRGHQKNMHHTQSQGRQARYANQKSPAACFCFLRFHPGSLPNASRVVPKYCSNSASDRYCSFCAGSTPGGTSAWTSRS